MSNLPISGLAAGAAVSATDVVPNVQTTGVGPVQTTAAQLKTFISASPYFTGNVGVGTSSPQAHFQVTYEGASSGFFTDGYQDTSVYHYFAELRNTNTQGYGEGYYASYSRGTYSAPAAAQVNDVLGYFGFGSYSSASGFNGYDYSTAISAIVDATPTTGLTPAAIIFYTNGISYNGATTTPYEKMRLSSAGNLGIGTISPGTLLTVAGPISVKSPSTITATTYTIAATDASLIFSTNNCTVTMPAASTYPGRILNVKNISAITVNSASSNIVPLATSTAGTAILSATAGKWAMLQSNGTNWVIMASN